MDINLEFLIRVYLGVFFTGIAIFYSLRLALSKHKGALSFVGKFGTRHFLGHITFRIFRILIWGVCVIRIFYPEFDSYLIILSPIYIPMLNLGGAIIMTLGFVFVLHSHNSMENTWRLGIDPDGTERLITTGIFAKTRNPIFIGVMLGQFGFFLALPSVFSTVCLILGVASILSQVKLEEEYLSDVWGKQYQDYCKQVPRWL